MEKTCLLVLAGAPPSEDLLMWRMEDSDYLFAVVGCFCCFLHSEKIPFIVIGDLYSLYDFV